MPEIDLEITVEDVLCAEIDELRISLPEVATDVLQNAYVALNVLRDPERQGLLAVEIQSHYPKK